MMKDNCLIEFDGMKTTHLFYLVKDPMQQHNLLKQGYPEQEKLEFFLKAFIQQYNNRLIENRLIAE